MLGHEIGRSPEDHDLVLAALLCVVGGQVRVVHQFLSAGGRIGRRADAHTHREGLEPAAVLCQIDLSYPVLDLLGQGTPPLGILQRQQHGKHLAAGAEYGAALSHRPADDLTDAAQRRVALTHAVELVIELEVIHIDVQKRQALPAIQAELLIQLFHKEAVVVHACQGVDPRLPEHLLIQRRVLHGDGGNGAHRLQKADLRGIEVPSPLLGGEQHQSHNLAAVPHGRHAVDVQPAEKLLFRLPQGEIPGAVAELPQNEIALLLLEIGDLGTVLGKREGQRSQGAGTVSGLIDIPLQQAHIDLLGGDLTGDDLAELIHDVRRAQGLGNLPRKTLDQLVLLFFPGKDRVQQPAD